MSTRPSIYRMRPVLAIVLLALAVGAIWVAPAAAAPLPDLVISYAKVTMKCKADGTRTANIFAIVKNQGQGTADLSKNPWHIVLRAEWWNQPGGEPKTLVPQAGGPKALKPGGIFPANLTIGGIKPPPPLKGKNKGTNMGQYQFVVTADPAGIVAEANEANNSKNLFVKVGEECDQ